MKEILNDAMIHEIMEALLKGEEYGYSDDNTSIHVTPNSLKIQFHSTPKVNVRETETNKFLEFCDSLHEDLFVETCESFDAGELERLQNMLDTDNYRETIKIFSNRVGEIANNRLTEICNAADSEIRRQEMIIENAKKAIEDIHKELDEAHAKYAI